MVAISASVAWLYQTTPGGDTGTGSVDALLVLGAPAELNGSLTPVQTWRVNEAVREFRAGRAPRIVFAGGLTNGRNIESQIMGAEALRQGVPPESICEETRSRTTLENLDNTVPFLKQHGWTRVEVISTPAHLHRAAVLLQNSGLQWRLHAAPMPGLLVRDRRRILLTEAVGTAALRVFGPRVEPVLHGVIFALGRIGGGYSQVRLRMHS